MCSSSVMFHRPTHEYVLANYLVINPYETLAVIISGCVSAVLERRRDLALNALLKIQIAGVSFAFARRVTTPVTKSRSSLEEILTDLQESVVETSDKVDVRNVETLKVVQHGKQGKKKGKKGGTGNSKQGNQDAKENGEKRRKEEEERLQKWNDDWDKKLKAQGMLDDIPCCSAQGLFLKPKTQSNVWIKVTKDKMTQDVQMAFMHVPVPKPKPPPLPKLVKKIVHEEPAEAKSPKAAKKKGKGKKK